MEGDAICCPIIELSKLQTRDIKAVPQTPNPLKK